MNFDRKRLLDKIEIFQFTENPLDSRPDLGLFFFKLTVAGLQFASPLTLLSQLLQ